MMKLKSRKLQIKNYSSSDVDNLWAWEPETNAVFYCLEMDIGWEDEEAADIYSVIVATPNGVLDVGKNSLVFGEIHRILLLDLYSWRAVRTSIEAKVSAIDTYDESEAVLMLERYFYWEYECMK